MEKSNKNNSFKEVMEQYSEIKSCKNGLFIVKSKSNGKFGVVNLDSEVVIPFEYEDISETSYGKFKVLIEVDDKKSYGIIDINSNLIIPCIYSSIDEDKSGFIVCNSGYNGYPRGNGLVSHIG